MSKRNTYNRVGRILDAAAILIATYGYDKTTVSDIAEKAGVAKGAIYLHWPSKEDLFGALIAREMQRLMEDLLSRVEADPSGGTLPHMYRHALLALQANPMMCALYTRDNRVLGDYIHRQDQTRYTERFLFGRTFVACLQEAGLVRKEIDPESLSYLLSIIAYGFASIGVIIPADQAPSLESTAYALDVLISQGIALQDGDSSAGVRALRLGINEINRQYAQSGSGQITLENS